jgi:hypothetical protein
MDTVPDWMDRPVTRLSLTVLGCVQGWLLILEHFASAGSIYLEHEAACQNECQLPPLIVLLPEMASRITCSLQLARISSPGCRSPCGCDVVASCCPAKSYLFLA